ncbi:hypothetical protein NDU88_004584 [Pleurodeles waltl]|uniref:Uncharacterized protein n=1 Tax=Pleurodeles waltl TaxID=8319 RepID=A0AAV7VGM2_PLEWA|nr:hypothetical protein NDU88_004584 [Pleurodeles waltl]
MENYTQWLQELSFKLSPGNQENPRWRPDFPADRHHRSSPSLVCRRLSLIHCESRGCRKCRAPAAWTTAGASRLSGGFPKEQGRVGKRRRAPQEESSAALAPEPRSSSFRSSATPLLPGDSIWRLGRPDGAKADQNPLLLTARQNQDRGGTRKDKKIRPPVRRSTATLTGRDPSRGYLTWKRTQGTRFQQCLPA